jgi:hypothetical protein
MRFKLVPVVLASALALSSTSAFAQGHQRSHHRGYNPDGDPYRAYNSVEVPRGYWNAPAGGPARIAPGRGGYDSGWLDDSNISGAGPGGGAGGGGAGGP